MHTSHHSNWNSHAHIPQSLSMAHTAVPMYLTEEEEGKLKAVGVNDSRIDYINRVIGERLTQREQGWSAHGEFEAMKILLVGPEGSGKSSLGNLLLGDSRETFSVSRSEAGTTICKSVKAKLGNTHIEIVDTPGNVFTEVEKNALLKEIIGRTSANPNALKEIREHVKAATVIIVVLNSSYKREPNMGISAMMKEFLAPLSHMCMMVTTHSRSHYDGKTVQDLLDDLRESPEVQRFLECIGNRLVMVELGDGNQSSNTLKNGQAVYEAERDQAREMILKMARVG